MHVTAILLLTLKAELVFTFIFCFHKVYCIATLWWDGHTITFAVHFRI